MVHSSSRIAELTWAPGDSGTLPILYRSQTDTEGVSQLRLGQSEVFTQLPRATSRRRAAISSTGGSRMAQQPRPPRFSPRRRRSCDRDALADEFTELRGLLRRKAVCI